MKIMRILSGIQPSGRLHIGNYFGAIRQHIRFQNEGHQCFYFIANYHALTSVWDRKELETGTLHVAMGYLALITRQAPVEIAAERTKIEELLEKAMAELEHSLDAHNIAALLSESLRQQFEASGLAVNGQLLRNTANDFSEALDTFLDPARGALARLSGSLARMQADLDNAACHIRALSRSLAQDLHRALAVVAIGALVLGFLLGAHVQWIK